METIQVVPQGETLVLSIPMQIRPILASLIRGGQPSILVTFPVSEG